MPDEDDMAEIKCRLFMYSSLDSGRTTHRYGALSYVWGDQDNPLSISVNGHSLAVGKNLHVALSHLRNHALERILWIDAIWVNQKDLEERGLQVQLIGKMYSKASLCGMWESMRENWKKENIRI